MRANTLRPHPNGADRRIGVSKDGQRELLSFLAVLRDGRARRGLLRTRADKWRSNGIDAMSKANGQGEAVKFILDGQEVEARPGETIFQVAGTPRHRAAAPLLRAQARLSPRRQLPRLYGRDRGRARACRELHPHPDAGHEGQDPDRSRQDRAPHGGRAPDGRPARARRNARSGIRVLGDGGAHAGRREPLPARGTAAA